MNKSLVIIVGIVGVLLVVLAGIYFSLPANALPVFIPGHDKSITIPHYKHGIGALFLGLACFAFAWFQSGKKPSDLPHEEK
jgi:drug/metabolite transporter (DMT)-like permease